jgi:Pyruvate/2-oxoacid:ferredoxin oxidoreductase gamma subunit
VLEQHLRVGQSPDPTTQKSEAMDADIVIAITPESAESPDNSGDNPSPRPFRRKR